MKLPSLKDMKKSSSLPIIKKKYKILNEESKKELLLYSSNSLSHQIDKVREIKILYDKLESYKNNNNSEFNFSHET